MIEVLPSKRGQIGPSGTHRAGLRISAPAASTFTPTQITGLQVWFKADAGTSTTTDGVGVSAWNDQSGNARNAAQATGANQPIYKTAIQNGLPILRFDGIAQFIEATTVNVAQPDTMFLVAKNTVVGSARSAIDGFTTRQQILIASTGGGSVGFFAGTTEIDSATTWGTTNFHYISAVFNGASSQLWIDAVSGATGNPGAAALNDLLIGCFNRGSAFWQGDIGEVLVYNTALSTTNRQSVETYLKNRWGL